AELLHVSHKVLKASCEGCAAQAIRLLDSGVDVTVPPEPKYEPGQVVRLRLEDGMPYLAKRVDSNDGWEVFGVDVVITDDEVTDVEPVAVLTAEDVRELRKNRGISNYARFFRERGLDLSVTSSSRRGVRCTAKSLVTSAPPAPGAVAVTCRGHAIPHARSTGSCHDHRRRPHRPRARRARILAHRPMGPTPQRPHRRGARID